MQNMGTMIPFTKTSALLRPSALTLIGSNDANTNDNDAEIRIWPDDGLSRNPTAHSRVSGLTSCALTIEVDADSPALADFAIVAVPNRLSTPVVLLSGSDWGTITGILKHKVGSINTLAAGATGYIHVEHGPADSIAFQGRSAATELLTNGTFTGSATGWTEAGDSGTEITYNANAVDFLNATATFSQAKSAMAGSGATWIENHLYEYSFTITNYSAGGLQIGTAANPEHIADLDGNPTPASANGTYTGLVLSDGASAGLVFTASGFTGTLDTVSLKKCAIVTLRGMLYR